MKIEKTFIKRYEVITVKRNFCVFDEKFKQTRLRYHVDKSMNCFKCGKKFTNGDNVNVFFMFGDRNRLCCDNCADEFEGESK